MDLARLASNKQASKLAPQGHFWAPEQKGSQNRENKCYHAIQDGFLQLSHEQIFPGRTPTWSETVIYGVFGPFWAAGTWRNSGPGRKTAKRNFPELGALLGGKSVRPKSFSPKLRNFFFIFRFGRTDLNGREIAK